MCTDKKEVLLLFGGVSPEHEVSCNSAAGIMSGIDREKYNLHIIGITRDGEWLYTKATGNELRDGSWIKNSTNKRAIVSADRRNHGIIIFEEDRTTIQYIDVIFPIVHGENGEDGTLQGLFEIAGIPYVGSGVCASACSIDKAVTRIFADKAGLLQPECYMISTEEFAKRDEGIVKEIEEYMGYKYPMIVKPSMTGSSIGISKVENGKELYDALVVASQYRGVIMVEEFISGSEIKVAVLEDNDGIKVGEICEIVVENGMFNSFELKYKSAGTHKRIPAVLDKSIEKEIKESAVKIFKELGCKDFSRVDFFLTNDNKVYFNEINTIPGFDVKSIFILMFNETGMTYTDIINTLIDGKI